MRKKKQRIWVVVADGVHARFLTPDEELRRLQMEKHKFTAQLAKVLDGAVGKRSFDSLVLVAPRRSLGELRELLSDRVQACLRHEMAKDLTKSSRTELWKKLAPTVKDIAVHE
jgi:protein required for attachment to host cells